MENGGRDREKNGNNPSSSSSFFENLAKSIEQSKLILALLFGEKDSEPGQHGLIHTLMCFTGATITVIFTWIAVILAHPAKISEVSMALAGIFGGYSKPILFIIIIFVTIFFLSWGFVYGNRRRKPYWVSFQRGVVLALGLVALLAGIIEAASNGLSGEFGSRD